ncbi:MAG: hypothetical protein LBL28_06880 [Treponema sp.]|jgi:hypothetical protein|nr:hypothetical protein [Treponema sp.]
MLTGFEEYYHVAAILNTHKRTIPRFLVMIPHREARDRVRAWSGRLFAAGAAGAGAFPWVVPLVVLSRPLNPGELRAAAFALREANSAGDGKFRSGGPAMLPLPALCRPGNPGDSQGGGSGGGEYPALYGLVLDMVLPELPAAAVLRRLSPAVLGAALVESPEDMPGRPAAAPGAGLPPLPEPLPAPPEIAFRAAALANMIYRVRRAGEGALLFEWKIGKPRWLPSRGATRNAKRSDPLS